VSTIFVDLKIPIKAITAEIIMYAYNKYINITYMLWCYLHFDNSV